MTDYSQEPLPPANPAFRESLMQLIVWANETYSVNNPEHCERIIRRIYRLWDVATK